MLDNNIINSIMHTLAGDVWEIRQTIVLEPLIATDPQDITTIKVKLAGMFSYVTPEMYKMPGITADTDAVFASAERISLSSQILHDNILFEIISEDSADGYAVKVWTYGLHKTGDTILADVEYVEAEEEDVTPDEPVTPEEPTPY